MISKLLTFGFELAVLAAVALITGEGVSARWLALPLVLGVHSALNLGGAFIAARLNDSFRDIQQIIPFVFRLLTYLSGVMFPLGTYLTDEKAGGTIATIVRLNPLVGILDLYRWVFMGTPVTFDELWKLLVISGFLLTFGFWYFRSAESKYGRA